LKGKSGIAKETVMSKFHLSWIAAGLFVFTSIQAEAMTRYGAVYESGQVIFSSQPMSRTMEGHACDENPDLIFTFAESVSQAGLALDVRDQASGSISLSVNITLACRDGSAIFAYEHEPDGSSGVVGQDIEVNPQSFGINLPLAAGASEQLSISYEALESAPFATEYRFVLAGDRVSFFAGDVFGQAGERRELAAVTVAAGDVIDIGAMIDADNRTIRAGGALNDACEQAPPGSTLFQTCMEIDQFAQTPAQLRQASNAFDAHQITAVPAASTESTRIQSGNVAERLEMIRTGTVPRLSLEGLAFRSGGQDFSLAWLPTSLSMRANGESSDDIGSQLLADRWGAFVNGTVTIGDRSRRGDETGFDYDAWGITAGVDYRFDNGAVLGVSAGFSRYSADLEGNSGKVDGDSYSFQAYGTFDLIENLFIDATLGYTATDFDFGRVVDLSGIGSLTRSTARGSTDARVISATLSLNYRIRLDNAWTITPYGQFGYSDIEIDSFSESGSPFDYRYPSQSLDSQLWSAGIRVNRPISLDRGVLVPFADIAYEYEGGVDGYSLQPVLVESGLDGPMVSISNPDRSTGRLDLGASWVFLTGNQLFFTYSALLADSDTTRHSFYFGARWEF
jgi:outer membrane autotransporter protein